MVQSRVSILGIKKIVWVSNPYQGTSDPFLGLCMGPF